MTLEFTMLSGDSTNFSEHNQHSIIIMVLGED